MQFVLDRPIEEGLKPVGFNFEQLKTEIASVAETYKGLVVTEETIKDAKATRAKLNAFRTALEDERKRIKKLYQQPLVEFEGKVAELTKLIDVPILAIDDQLKAFEIAAKNEKKEQIEQYFKTAFGEYANVVPFDTIWNPRWLNATYRIQDIWEEIDDAAIKVKGEIDTLRSLNLEFEQAAFSVYLQTMSVAKAIEANTKMLNQAERMKKVINEPPKQEEPAAEPAEEAPVQKTFYDSELVKPIDMRVYVNEKQKAALREFLTANKIRYTKVPKN